MLKVLRHRLRLMRDNLRQQIPDHFIAIICIATAVIYIPIGLVQIFVGSTVLVLLGPLLWTLFLGALMFLTFTGKPRYDPAAAAIANRDLQRKRLRRKNRDLRLVTDQILDDLYQLNPDKPTTSEPK